MNDRMDKVFIEGLTVETVIGVYDWERHGLRPLLVDLEMTIARADFLSAAASDHPRDALDYQEVTDAVAAYAGTRQDRLLETFAEHLLRMLFARFAQLVEVSLRLGKPGAVPGARMVGLKLERVREDYTGCGIR